MSHGSHDPENTPNDRNRIHGCGRFLLVRVLPQQFVLRRCCHERLSDLCATPMLLEDEDGSFVRVRCIVVRPGASAESQCLFQARDVVRVILQLLRVEDTATLPERRHTLDALNFFRLLALFFSRREIFRSRCAGVSNSIFIFANV